MINTSWYEVLAVISGIASVWFSRKANVLVYPVGLINTIIYIIISVQGHLFGEATVNLYYTVMSVYGWMVWTKKDIARQPVVHVTRSNRKEWLQQILFFLASYLVICLCLIYLKKQFAPKALPASDAFASATAFTGMWMMARKKVESWYWWIATNLASIPLYFVKGYSFTSYYYGVLLILSFFGLAEWLKKSKAEA